MDDQKSDGKNDFQPASPGLQPVTPSLKGVVRRARIDEAERSGVMAELRGAEIARLEMLAEALEPVFAQVPENVDLFDSGVVPGAQPRLYIDMIAFVEMAPDKRTYRFIQNTRHGRVTAGASEKPDKMVDIITTYVARRLIEREQALAGDRTVEEAARAYALSGHAEGQRDPVRRSGLNPVSRSEAGTLLGMISATAVGSVPNQAQAKPVQPRRGFRGALLEGLIFVAELIGFIVLLVALFGALYFAWTMGEAWWTTYFNKTV